MSTTPSIDPHTEPAVSTGDGPQPRTARLLVCLPSQTSESLQTTVANLEQALPSTPVLVASPDHAGADVQVRQHIHLIELPTSRPELGWVLAAGDYGAAARLQSERQGSAVLVLGNSATAPTPGFLRHAVEHLHAGSDLVVPRYQVGPHDGLVTAALLYPVTRALFAQDIRYPLAIDAALSPRMIGLMGSVAGRQSGAGSAESLLWPVSEAAQAGFAVREVSAGSPFLPQPEGADFNTLFTTVAGSLFANIDAKATFWQRARSAATVPRFSSPVPSTAPSDDTAADVRSMVDTFALASRNLGELWMIVLPPQTLMALKKLAASPAESFYMPPNLWARITYDFALAFHTRSLNRSHLLGAYTPLYLAWVASRLRHSAESSSAAAQLEEENALAFEREKPYLVSRWRWPDRFNP